MRTGRDIFNTPPTRVKTPPTGPPQHRALSASLARPWGLWGPVGPVLGALGLLLGRSWRARGRFWDAWGALECYLVAHGTLVLVFPIKTGGTHWNARRNAPDFSVFPTKTSVAKEWNALERTAERTPNVAPVLVLPIRNRCGVGAHTRLHYNIIN